MTTNNQRGGPRSGAGGTVSTIKISKAHAKRLRTLLKARPGGAYSQAEVERWAETQIDAAYKELAAELDQAEAQAWEGEVL
jgi:hypothetical protein